MFEVKLTKKIKHYLDQVGPALAEQSLTAYKNVQVSMNKELISQLKEGWVRHLHGLNMSVKINEHNHPMTISLRRLNVDTVEGKVVFYVKDAIPLFWKSSDRRKLLKPLVIDHLPKYFNTDLFTPSINFLQDDHVSYMVRFKIKVDE